MSTFIALAISANQISILAHLSQLQTTIWITNENTLIIIGNDYSFIVSNSTTTHYYVDHAVLDIYHDNYDETIDTIIYVTIVRI